MGAIYLKQGQSLVEMTETPYEAEAILQSLLADYPGLLAGDEEGEGRRRWLLVKRELGLASEVGEGDRWSLDHLFLDQQGIPTLVEVKRSSDSRIRREVVGQMLDYAANGSVVWSLDSIQSSFELDRQATGGDADEDLITFLGDRIEPDEFWDRVDTNLNSGRLRLVFVADQIPSELRRVIEFLNEQMNRTEVLGLEIKQYVESDGERLTLVPRLIGKTEAARQAKGSGGRPKNPWNEPALISAIQDSLAADYAERMISLYEGLRDAGARRSWGTGVTTSVTMWLGESDDPKLANPVSISIYAGSRIYEEASIAINFDFVRDKRSEAEMNRLAGLMREIPGVPRYIDGVEDRNWGMHRGMRPQEVLPDDSAARRFVEKVVEAAQPPNA